MADDAEVKAQLAKERAILNGKPCKACHWPILPGDGIVLEQPKVQEMPGRWGIPTFVRPARRVFYRHAECPPMLAPSVKWCRPCTMLFSTADAHAAHMEKCGPGRQWWERFKASPFKSDGALADAALAQAAEAIPDEVPAPKFTKQNPLVKKGPLTCDVKGAMWPSPMAHVENCTCAYAKAVRKLPRCVDCGIYMTNPLKGQTQCLSCAQPTAPPPIKPAKVPKAGFGAVVLAKTEMAEGTTPIPVFPDNMPLVEPVRRRRKVDAEPKTRDLPPQFKRGIELD